MEFLKPGKCRWSLAGYEQIEWPSERAVEHNRCTSYTYELLNNSCCVIMWMAEDMTKKVVQMTSETVFMYLPNGVANRLQVCKPESEDEPEETIEMLQSRLFHNKDTLSQNIFKTALAFFFLFLSFTATSISLVKLWNLLTIYSAGYPAASNWICLLDLNRYITNITSTIQNRSNLNQDTANWNWNVGVDSWTTAR